MSKTMPEVLMAHWSASTHTERKPFVDKCDGCGAVIFSWGDPTVADLSSLAAHQAAALSAAGFGFVADAKGEALEEAADEADKTSSNIINNNINLYPAWDGMAEGWKNAATRLRARAAAVRGEG